MVGGESKAPAAEQAAPEYGAKYQQHMGTLQKQLEEAKQTWALLSQALPALLPHSLPPCWLHHAVPGWVINYLTRRVEQWRSVNLSSSLC